MFSVQNEKIFVIKNPARYSGTALVMIIRRIENNEKEQRVFVNDVGGCMQVFYVDHDVPGPFIYYTW